MSPEISLDRVRRLTTHKTTPSARREPNLATSPLAFPRNTSGIGQTDIAPQSLGDIDQVYVLRLDPLDPLRQRTSHPSDT
jgi:hypothetical protein